MTIDKKTLAAAVRANDDQTDTTAEAEVSPLPALMVELDIEPDAAFHVAEQRALRALAHVTGQPAEELTVEDAEANREFIKIQGAQFLDGLAAGLRARKIMESGEEVEEPDPTKDPSVRKWMRDRPDSVKLTMRVFPPGCEVEAANGYDLKIPAEGIKGRVVGFTEHETVYVTVENGTIRGECGIDSLVVTDYPTFTPEQIAEILDEDG
jgi:hypothetical protein